MSLIDQARAVRDRIAARLSELEPLVREYNELKQLASEMGVGTESVGDEPAAPSSPASPRPAAPRPAPPRAQRRPPGARGRATAPGAASDVAERVLAAVGEQPGKTVAEYAETLDLSPTSLYRPVRELASSGQLVKRARQLFLPE